MQKKKKLISELTEAQIDCALLQAQPVDVGAKAGSVFNYFGDGSTVVICQAPGTVINLGATAHATPRTTKPARR